MRKLNGARTHVFAKSRHRFGVMSENAARQLVQRFDPDITGHGFRAAFKTWARGQRIHQPGAIEMALAHEPAKLEAADQSADLPKERAAIMQGWAEYVPGRRDPPMA